MSCLKPHLVPSDDSVVGRNPPVIESNDEYSELVQQSYETLFGPWLKSAEEDSAEQSDTDTESNRAKTPN